MVTLNQNPSEMSKDGASNVLNGLHTAQDGSKIFLRPFKEPCIDLSGAGDGSVQSSRSFIGRQQHQ